MNLKIIFKILGLVVSFLGLTMLLPIPFSMYYDRSDVNGILFSSIITVTSGIAAYIYFSRKIEKRRYDMRLKDGFAIVGLSWISMALFGSLPFVLTGAIPNFTDAFFETISGLTTTGASILNNVEGLPKGVLFWRSFTHWIGGMGIIVLSIAILPFLGIGGMQLFKAEVSGPTTDKLTPRITETAKILWGVYFLITIVLTILLIFGGMNLFDALCHSFGTMATGGYSTKNASVAAFDSSYIDYVITIFMVICGISFSLHYRLLKGDFKALWNSEEAKWFLAIIAIVSTIICIDVFKTNYHTISDTIRFTLFQVVSLMTTTGYATADYELWSESSQFLLLFLMFVGGCAGSTAGGLKVVRLILLLKFAYSEFARLIHPKAIIPVRIGGIAVERNVLSNISGFFVIYAFISGISVIILSFFGIDFQTSITAVIATLNNIGPGVGSIGPMENYAHFPSAVKWFLSFLMLLGRLEIYTILILLTPTFWRK